MMRRMPRPTWTVHTKNITHAAPYAKERERVRKKKNDHTHIHTQKKKHCMELGKHLCCLRVFLRVVNVFEGPLEGK